MISSQEQSSEIKDSASGPSGRREFLRAAGLAGLALSVGSSLSACSEGGTGLVAPSLTPRRAIVNGNNITLDFSLDIDVLNYAYALEQLEAAFYLTVVGNASFTSIFSANEQRILNDLRDHEVAHRDFFKAALGAAAIPGLTPDFSSIDFGNRMSVLSTAQTFEDLGVAAYNGAARYIKNQDYLTVAGKIVSVEARHAAAIRGTLNGNRTGSFAPQAFDPAFPPPQVLTSAGPFVMQSITAINT